MKKRMLLTAVTVMFLMSAVPIVISEDSTAATEPTFFIEGYVIDSNTGNTPMQGVKVTVRDSAGNITDSETDSTGKFSVGVYTNTDLLISFTAYGYVITSCPNISKSSYPDYFILNLKTANYNYPTYTITSSTDGMQCAVMGLAVDSQVEGAVQYSGGYVKNAVITLTHEDGDVYTANTEETGNYKIICPPGYYEITASRQGFEDSEPVQITVPSSFFVITLEESPVGTKTGLDSIHILMLIGVIVGILLAISAWHLSQREDPKLVNDSEEDSNIRYP